MKDTLFFGKIVVFFFSLLFAFSIAISTTQAQNSNLNGLWINSSGVTVEVRQTGNTVTGIIKKSSYLSQIGKAFFTGTVDRNTFNGKVFLTAGDCPNLESLEAAIGTVSEDKIILTTNKAFSYYAEACEKLEERTDSVSLIRVLATLTPTPTPTAVPTISSQPTVSSQTGGNFQTRIDIPGYTQALVDKPPKASDFQNIPQSDFTTVYPTGKTLATQKLSTESANTTDSIFIGKVGKGEVVVESPNGEKITLTDDMSGIDFFNKRFGATLPGPEMGNPTQLTIREVDCHIIASRNDSGNCDSSGRCRYPDIWDAQTRIDKTVGDCTYLNEGGPVRVLAEQGQVTLKTPGGVTVTASKADFGIAYDAKSTTSIVEVYNGSVTVTNKAGQAKKLSTVYGSQIERIEVNKNGEMTEKIAIPQSQWEAFLASQQKEAEKETSVNASPVLIAIIVLGVGGIVFFLYRKGKLMPLYKTLGQKVSGMTKKTSKNNKQQDSA